MTNLLWRTVALLACGMALGVAAGAQGRQDMEATSPFLHVALDRAQPALTALSVDSLGLGKLSGNVLKPPAAPGAAFAARQAGAGLEYRRAPGSKLPGWAITPGFKGVVLTSNWSEEEHPEPITLAFDTSTCHATLLGWINSDSSVKLPAVLHLPSRGSFRIEGRGAENMALGYAAPDQQGVVTVSFPPATAARPRVEYRWEVAAIHPALPNMAADARLNAVRRDWLNALQLSPSRRVLANHAASDTCAFVYYVYADIARQAPPLAKGVRALDCVRQSLDRVLGGMLAYGMPGYGDFPEPTADTYPSLLIATYDYVDGTGDTDWLRANYDGVRGWADKMLATDRNGDGLIEYAVSGNSGSWPKPLKNRPSNWWDTIGFGHDDAYANALAYRALRGMEQLARKVDKTDDAARYRRAANRLKAAYFAAFFNPATGVLAGWRSADGQLHDYYFLWVNGIAIHYGLVPRDKANGIMDRLLAKMKEVGYTRFDLGLPGNLIPVASKDYAHHEQRWGGGEREDNADGFQIYENGGATACYAYFTLAALYDLGRRQEADAILFPMLAAIDKGGFEGRGANGMTNDWKMWDGTPWGYEGFLVDNYYVLLAALTRENRDPSAALLR